MTTKEIKQQALEIMHKNGNTHIRLSDFTIRQAKGVIREHNYKQITESPVGAQAEADGFTFKKSSSNFWVTPEGKAYTDANLFNFIAKFETFKIK